MILEMWTKECVTDFSVCVCVWEREREGGREMCVCVCVWEREREREISWSCVKTCQERVHCMAHIFTVSVSFTKNLFEFSSNVIEELRIRVYNDHLSEKIWYVNCIRKTICRVIEGIYLSMKIHNGYLRGVLRGLLFRSRIFLARSIIVIILFTLCSRRSPLWDNIVVVLEIKRLYRISKLQIIPPQHLHASRELYHSFHFRKSAIMNAFFCSTGDFSQVPVQNFCEEWCKWSHCFARC